MGSVGREQSGFASTRAREARSQNSTRPGWKGEGGIPSSADVPLVAAVKGWCSHPRWPLKKTSQTRLKSRDGSTIVLRLRILIMLPEDWYVHDGNVEGVLACPESPNAVEAWSSVLWLGSLRSPEAPRPDMRFSLTT